MNYLQLPAGSGEEQSFDFDLSDFAKRFKLDSFQTLYALKALEQEGLLIYNEQFFSPSVVQFTSSRSQLELYEQVEPAMGEVIKGLLRSYEGIFDYPSEINEANFAAFLKRPIPEVEKALRKLSLAGIIDYAQQKDKPQVRFLENRIVSSQIQIDYTAINKRKKAFSDRLHTILNYTRTETECRSKMISVYFGEINGNTCGVCDNCLNNKNVELSGDELAELSNKIKSITSSASLDANEVIVALQPASKKKIWKVLDYLCR